MIKRAAKVAIIDAVPKVYRAHDNGITDGQKFAELLAPHNSEIQTVTYYAAENQFPGSLDHYDALLLGGSPLSVHDDYDWIRRLSSLVLAAAEKGKPVVACCFSHQLVAKTFGGKVARNEKDWMIGNYTLEITRQYDWMEPPARQISLYHFNKERVVRLPEAAQSFAHTEDYPDYGYTLFDNILCVQGHPEQPRRALSNFLAAVKNEMSESSLARAESMINRGEPDAGIWAQWMTRFILSRCGLRPKHGPAPAPHGTRRSTTSVR